MPRSTQQRFTDLLAAECQARGLELIVNGQWANTGAYSIHGSALRPLLTIGYDWQTSRDSHWRGGGYVTLTPDREVSGITDRAVHYADLDVALRCILSLFALTGGKLDATL